MADGAKRGPERVTIRTVAADAGVSVAAVSKVLRNAYGVSEALRARVLQSIERLGYRPNVAARGLRGRTFTLGVLLTDLVNPFLSEIIDGIYEVTAEAGYKVLIGVGRSNVPIETSLIESMMDARMDGLILVSPKLDSDVMADMAAQIPIVALAHHDPEATAFDTVNCDDFAGAGLAVAHFRAAGRQRIAMMVQDISGSPRTNVAAMREAGFRAAMGEGARVLALSMDEDENLAQMERFLAEGPPPDAVFAWSDLHGILLLDRAEGLGLRIPEGLGLIGYDNSPPARLRRINLTSVDQDGRGQGRAAANAILSRVAGRRSAQHQLLRPRLVLRGTH